VLEMPVSPQEAPRMHTPSLKQRSDLHLSRKLWHCAGISAMTAFYNVFGPSTSWTALLLLSLFFIPIDFLRLRYPGLNMVALKVFGPLMRTHESVEISGMTYLFVGCMFLLLFSNPHVVTLTLLFLAFGDPIASFFGIRYGKDRILGPKTLQGTLAAFTTCTALAAIYYYSNNLMVERLLIVAPLSGLIGALSELLPIGKLDDNLTFPVVCSCLLWVLFYVYGA